MNIEACYNKMGADYAEVKSRLPSDAFIKRFALKFLDDPTLALLEKSLAEENVDEAFRAAHTLKGITQNLGFSQLDRDHRNPPRRYHGRHRHPLPAAEEKI